MKEPYDDEEVRNALQELLIAGNCLANIAYNLKQKEGYVLKKGDIQIMEQWQLEWDEQIRKIPITWR